MKYTVIHLSQYYPERHKVLFKGFNYALVQLLPYNSFKTAEQSEYVAKRKALLKELYFYESQGVPADSQWYESNENCIDAIKEELMLLDAQKELGLIK